MIYEFKYFSLIRTLTPHHIQIGRPSSFKPFKLNLIFKGPVPERPKGSGSGPDAVGLPGFESRRAHTFYKVISKH